MKTHTPRKIRLLTFEKACELLAYDSVSGILRWRVDRLSGNGKAQVRAGDVAGHEHASGYLRVKIDGILHKAHHVIWLLMTGKYPERQIDHKDGCGFNNRWTNLRLATEVESARNRFVFKSNTSGAVGVDLKDGKWRARITVNYQQIDLGRFETLDAAIAARVLAEKNYFGEFRAQA